MRDKLAKLISVFKKDGIKKATGKVLRYSKGFIKSHMGLAYRIDFKKHRDGYLELIKEATRDTERVLIWRSSFGWDVPLFQRPQHIARAMARTGSTVFYEVTPMTDDVKGIKKAENGLYLVNFQNKHLSELLLTELDGFSGPKYLQFYSTDWTMSVDYVNSFITRGYKILYEYIDDLSPKLAGTKELPVNVREKYEAAMSDSENYFMVTTADLLFEDAKNRRGQRRLCFSTNGVDYGFFRDTSDEVTFDVDFMKVLETGKPLVGYYGAMAEWFDYDLIKMIDNTDRFTVVLFGIRYDDSLDRSGILDLKNVFFMGPRNYDVLKYYASKIDILTIPFVINDITKATSPLKLFEYMALHKPIVTSAMNECMKYRSAMIGHNADEFISLLDTALEKAKDPEYIALLDREARENSWSAKAEIITEMLASAEKGDG